MELELLRMYHAKGTNGILRINGLMCCYTIELPWNNNRRNKSCIPEGRYNITRRYSDRFRGHMQVMNVPGRTFILLHPANDAAVELKGCIAPVAALTGHGQGTNSTEAFKALRRLVYNALNKSEPVWLNIRPLEKAIAIAQAMVA